MELIASACTIIACGILNRARGDARWMPAKLPGRALFYVAPIIGLIAWAFMYWLPAAAFAFGYLAWGVGPWGYLQLLGHPVEGKRPEPLEKLLLAAAFGSAHGALFLRHMFILPLAAALAFAAEAPALLLITPAFAAGAVAAYEAAWRLRPANPIIWAELACGAMWGLIIVSQ